MFHFTLEQFLNIKWHYEIVANEELLFTTADHVSFSLKGFPPKNPGRNHVETSS